MFRKDKQQPAAPSTRDGGKAGAKNAEGKKPNPVKQLGQTFSMLRTIDPKIGWWMLLAFGVTVVVAEIVGILLQHWLYALFVGVMLGILAAMVVMKRRGDKAAYGAMEGQPGAAGAALQGLRGTWYYKQEPVAVDATRPGDLENAAYVFRALGRPGVVLISEGPGHRARRLAEAERKKVARVASGVPVTVVHVGRGKDDVPVAKLVGKLTKMKPVLTKEELSVVNKRLKSLGGLRAAVPAGMDPTRARVDRKAMRGR